jgi:transcriptional regulator with XRE-family HTH domain
MAYRTSEEWEVFLGEQVKASRLRKNMKQGELASRAGISVPTVARLEAGKGSSLASFIKVLGILKEDAWLERLAPQTSISPVQMLQRGKIRQRARG